MSTGVASQVTPASRFAGAWGSRLSRLRPVPPADLMGLAPGDTVLVVGAHPDDETIGVGATIASLAADGTVVQVLSMSAGEAALDHVDVVVEGLGAQRRDEFASACRELGVSAYDVLDLPDGRLLEHVDQMTDRIEHRLRAAALTHLLTVWWDDPHPDHQAVGRAAVTAAARVGTPICGFPIWALHWTDPSSPATTDRHPRLIGYDMSARERRDAAMRCYRTQTEPLGLALAPILPSEVVDCPHEVLVTP